MGWKTSSSQLVSRLPTGRARYSGSTGEAGVTMLELLVAMLILVMVTGMLYSVLNVGIGFSRKGEMRARQDGRERAFLGLLHRQVHGAWYDLNQKKVIIESAGNQLKLVTTSPLLNRDSGVVMAVYLYDPDDDILYYTEKKDFYNADYRDSFRANRREMLVLMREAGDISLNYLAEAGELKVTWRGRQHTLTVRCWQPEVG